MKKEKKIVNKKLLNKSPIIVDFYEWNDSRGYHGVIKFSCEKKIKYNINFVE